MIVELLASPDTAATVTHLAQNGSESINQSINTANTIVRTVGLSIMGLMVVLVAIMIAIAALKPEGAIRKNMTAIGVLLFAGLVMGAGTAFVGYMISLGSEVAG